MRDRTSAGRSGDVDSSSDLVKSALAMVSDHKTCDNCWHNRDGYCSMYSCECATAVSHHTSNPQWWTSYGEGEKENKRRVFSKVKHDKS